MKREFDWRHESSSAGACGATRRSAAERGGARRSGNIPDLDQYLEMDTEEDSINGVVHEDFNKIQIQWLKDHTVVFIFGGKAKNLGNKEKLQFVRNLEDGRLRSEFKAFGRGSTHVEGRSMITYIARSIEAKESMMGRKPEINFTLDRQKYKVIIRSWLPKNEWETERERERVENYWVMAALFLEIDVTNLTVWDPIIRQGNARQEEQEEEEESSEDSDDPDHIQEEEEDKEEEESAGEEEVAGGPSQQPERSREEEEAGARKRLEKAEGKRPVEERSPPDLSLGNPWLDPEPPKEDEGNDGAAAEGSGRRRRRSKSPTSSGSSAPPALRLRQHEGDRASSPFVLSLSP
ncbi:hypothetical protein CBR_g8773 [Chara braunii]|uniref:Uncharacterized protein n=1 Tax=Chara braunii TaxID=69332 RepID=A0A388KMR5_CHABU|nr:hypothetical protein CBR_g8773 [Chara braunii]|eukprot:GBG71354.1 hypothetical protein CBR_g8773 [Chara braunii]